MIERKSRVEWKTHCALPCIRGFPSPAPETYRPFLKCSLPSLLFTVIPPLESSSSSTFHLVSFCKCLSLFQIKPWRHNLFLQGTLNLTETSSNFPFCLTVLTLFIYAIYFVISPLCSLLDCRHCFLLLFCHLILISTHTTILLPLLNWII